MARKKAKKPKTVTPRFIVPDGYRWQYLLVQADTWAELADGVNEACKAGGEPFGSVSIMFEPTRRTLTQTVKFKLAEDDE